MKKCPEFWTHIALYKRTDIIKLSRARYLITHYKRKSRGSIMLKQEYIALINEELRQINNEYYFIVLYLLARKYREEGG